MQELRYILVALGGIAIAALLIHGLWSNRKSRQAPIKEKPLGRMEAKSRNRGDDAFDQDGVGQIRVVGGGRAEPKLRGDERRQPEPSRRPAVPAYDDEDDDIELPPPVVRKPAVRPVPPPPAPVYEEDEEEFEEPVAEVAEAAVAAPVRKPAQVIRRTPVHRARLQREPMMQPLHEEPMEPADAAAFGAHGSAQAQEYKPQSRYSAEPAYEEPAHAAPVQALAERPPVEKIWQDVYVINLMARPGQELQGATLLASLQGLGFTFGEMDIFHRHEEMGGQGEVLFSMANMVKPGTFDPHKMAQFSTPGVSLFMQLPLRSNAAFAFEYMLKAADQLAGDLDALLTDRTRSPLGEEDIVRYRQELAAYESSRD